ncbi:MAG: histidine kinase [Alphaproteobacteria bacterium]|nr:histidine kinase [Alphaproteobacteria bacterium]
MPPRAAKTEIDAERLFEGFEELERFRVQNILLVSSLYDSFILREDGRLNELLIGESLELNLQHVPGITHVSSGAEALALARGQSNFNLIVTNLRLGDMDAAALASEVKRSGLDIPVVVLAYDYREVEDFTASHVSHDIDRIFLWQGTPRILISMIKYIEDKRNVRHDTEAMDIPVILVVEDNIRYYSSFLPVIHTELITQSRRVISEGINVAHKLVRFRASPKLLLSSDYEDAANQVELYGDYLLGVVSDIEFMRDGQLDPRAGFELARMIRQQVPDVPIVLQSSQAFHLVNAKAEGFSFLRKRSPTLLTDLRKILTEKFSLGDFVFQMPDGRKVARAGDLNTLFTLLHNLPAESIAYHAARNDFSHWLMARTEAALARRLRPRKFSDFPNAEALRKNLLDSIAEYQREQSQVLVGDFDRDTFKRSDTHFLRIGGGSLGGKARGLAFVRHLLHKHRLTERIPGVRITVPPSVVLPTDLFDDFLQENDLLEMALNCDDDAVIRRRFLAAPLPTGLQPDLRRLLEQVSCPLAVRSSSLLEDSQYQPFTGVYETYMLPNRGSISERTRLLMEAIRRVYASTFCQHAKRYVQATPYRLEEEKMAVIIQEVVGNQHGSRFYPDIAGVLRSHNFYPMPPITTADGIASVALGMGRTVIQGENSLLFCPRYPKHLVQFSSTEDMLANSQTAFWALDLAAKPGETGLREKQFGLEAAEADGTLHAVGSTYSAENDAIYDGIGRPGIRLVSFAPILKHGIFPLAEILDEIMHIGADALGRPVEIEFAARLPQRPGEMAEFGFLQIRPLALSREAEEVRLDAVDSDELVCASSKVLGNGRVMLQDIVMVDFHRFERSKSQEVAADVAHFNARLNEERIPYLLIGVGRWGSNDPWLGIPVAWDQVSGARVIVEAGFRDMRVTPSQGSHFFQNLTAFEVGYFTVNPDAGDGFIDWDWLGAQPSASSLRSVRHLRLPTPLAIVMNGRCGAGAIFKPAG